MSPAPRTATMFGVAMPRERPAGVRPLRGAPCQATFLGRPNLRLAMPPLDAFLVVLRESLEAFLIIGILTGIVVKLGHPQARIPIYLGALAGVALSIVLGLVIHATAQDLFERHEEAFEGVVALVAVGREGIETVLFLATQVGSITAGGLVGATLAGVATSALLAALLFTGVIRLSLRGFFAVTGVLLILFAGGL